MRGNQDVEEMDALTCRTSHVCKGNDSTRRLSENRRTCANCRNMLRSHRKVHSLLQITLASAWLLLLLLSAPVSGINLPVAMPPSHPKHFLTVIGQAKEPKEKNEATARPGDVQMPVIREDEVMYHFYKNGRVGSDYRKASTIFMVRLFNDLLRGTKPPRPTMKSGDGNGQTPGDEQAAPFTDTIRSFSAEDVILTKKKKKTVVSFFVPFLPPNERLRLAEVRFLRHPSARSRKRKKRYKLRIDVLRSGRRVERVMLRERPDIQRDYDVFDVSRVLQPWINTHHGNVSLQIRLPRKLEKNILLKDSAMKSTSLIALYLEDSEFLKNMYESYTTDDLHVNSSDPVHGSSSKRTRGKRETAKKKRHRNGRKGKRWYRAGKHEKCQMYDFKVDFDFIGWGQWIIHPKSFNSRFCYGECPSPVDTKYKPTNHAMLQTLMRQKKPRLAPPTCCVPIKLKPLSMLYFEYDEIVVRHHENMIADECGCR